MFLVNQTMSLFYRNSVVRAGVFAETTYLLNRVDLSSMHTLPSSPELDYVYKRDTLVCLFADWTK